jgi:hypothetical protein
MVVPAYDILKKDAAALVWVESVQDLEFAKLRVKELAARCEAEYVISDHRTNEILGRLNALPTNTPRSEQRVRSRH